MPTERRMTVDGRIVEVFIPEAEPERQFSGDMPSLAFDMFGQINTGDPKVELARRMAEQRYDENLAQAQADVRTVSPRNLGAGINLDSPEALDRELFAPIRKKYGIADPNPKDNLRLFEMGNTLVQADPHSGASRVVFTGPTKQVEEKPADFVTGEDILGKQHVVKIKPSAFAANFSGFPEFARTNAVNLANMGTNAPRFTPPSNVPTVSNANSPSDSDIIYLRAHPEKKSAFEKRFGPGSAAAYLK